MTHPSPDTPDGELVGRVIAMPADTNPEGDIFGGWLLAQMDLAGSTPTTTYKLAIGDRVEKLEGDEFKLIQSGTIIVRESQTTLAS